MTEQLYRKLQKIESQLTEKTELVKRGDEMIQQAAVILQQAAVITFQLNELECVISAWQEAFLEIQQQIAEVEGGYHDRKNPIPHL